MSEEHGKDIPHESASEPVIGHQPGHRPGGLKKRALDVLWEYVQAILTALVLALIIKAFIIQAFKIPSGSMLQTLLVGDHLFVNKFLYGLDLPFTDKKILAIRQPHRGDIIVFRYPEDPRRDFIKRIVAKGGDTIESRDRKIYVNGSPVDEPHVQFTDPVNRSPNERRDNFALVKVPEGKLFVMGDNRDNSHDSRFWGFVDLADVRGKAFIIYWSQEGNILHPRWGRIGDLIQ